MDGAAVGHLVYTSSLAFIQGAELDVETGTVFGFVMWIVSAVCGGG